MLGRLTLVALAYASLACCSDGVGSTEPSTPHAQTPFGVLQRPERPSLPYFHTVLDIYSSKLVIVDPCGTGRAHALLNDLAPLDEQQKYPNGPRPGFEEAGLRIRNLSLQLGRLRSMSLVWEILAIEGPLPETSEGLELPFRGTAGILYLACGNDPVFNATSTSDCWQSWLRGLEDDVVVGHDVCFVSEAANLPPAAWEAFLFPVVSGEPLQWVRGLMREVLRSASGRGCGVAR